MASDVDPELLGQQKVDALMAAAKANGTLHELTEDEIESARRSAYDGVTQLPTIYNDQSELEYEVKQQENVANFDLKSE